MSEFQYPPASSGGGGGDATAANQATEIASLANIELGVASHRAKVLAANDKTGVITYGTYGSQSLPDTIVYSSASVGGASHTLTIVWTLHGTTYLPDSVTWS